MKAAKLFDLLFDGGGRERLPERVRAAIQRQQEQSEILIGWVQFGIVGFVMTLYESTRMAEGLVQEEYSLELDVLLVYGAICIVRLALAHKRLLATWMLYVSVIADIYLLMALIYSFHLKYAQTAAFYLKVPTLLYVFVFIALRALRFEARFVIFTGLCAAAGWAYLAWYVASGEGGPPNITHNFVEYMTSNALLVGAEVDKIIAILLTTAVPWPWRSRVRGASWCARSAKPPPRATSRGSFSRPRRRRPHPWRRHDHQGRRRRAARRGDPELRPARLHALLDRARAG